MKTLLIAITLFVPLMAFADPSPTPSGDDNLKNAMADMVKTTTQTLSQAKDFTVQQAPEVFQQFLQWEAYSNSVWAIGESIAILLIFLFGLLVAIACWESEGMGAGITCMIISIFAFFIFPMNNIMDNQKIRIAPKVYLIEYAKNLTK